MPTKIKAPDHLAPATAEWFRQVVTEYELESHHLRLLELAGSAWDEFQSARAAVAKHGQTFTDRYGQPRERPEVGIARQARIQFARLIREMAFDVEPRPTAASRRATTLGDIAVPIRRKGISRRQTPDENEIIEHLMFGYCSGSLIRPPECHIENNMSLRPYWRLYKAEVYERWDAQKRKGEPWAAKAFRKGD